MLLANQRLPDGNQIFNVPFAEINCREIFKYVHARGRFLKKKIIIIFFFVMKYCWLELPYRYLAAKNNKDVQAR